MRWMSAAVDQGCAIMSSAPNKGFCPCSEINTPVRKDTSVQMGT